MSVGSGGTIPFMGMLGEQFPQTQFFITGVLGPQSNAHGPNEFPHRLCAETHGVRGVGLGGPCGAEALREAPLGRPAIEAS